MKHPATGISRIEMYENSVNEETDAVSVRDMVDMFWYTTEKPSTFTSSGIKITVQKKDYTYEVYDDQGNPDLEWRRRNTFKQFYVQYDPTDMRSVRLLWMDKGGALRFERVGLPPIYIHRAQQEQTEEEKTFIRQQQEAIAGERVERQVIAKEIEYEHGVAPEQLRPGQPRPERTLQRGQGTDSTAVHASTANRRDGRCGFHWVAIPRN